MLCIYLSMLLTVVKLRLPALSLNLICFFYQCLSCTGSVSLAGMVLLTCSSSAANKCLHCSCSFALLLSEPSSSSLLLLWSADVASTALHLWLLRTCPPSLQVFPGVSRHISLTGTSGTTGSGEEAAGAGEGALPLWALPQSACYYFSLSELSDRCLHSSSPSHSADFLCFANWNCFAN